MAWRRKHRGWKIISAVHGIQRCSHRGEETVGRTIRPSMEMRAGEGFRGSKQWDCDQLWWSGDLPAMDDSRDLGFSNSEMGLHPLNQ